MTLEEKQKLIYETYKKRSKKWPYKCDVFVFNTPKSFSNLFLNNEVIFDSLWVERREVGYTRVWTVCVSSFRGCVWAALLLSNVCLRYNGKRSFSEQSRKICVFP